MEYNKKLINQAFDLKEKLKSEKNKKVIEDLIEYINTIYATYNDIEDIRSEINSLYEYNDRLILENNRLKKLIKATSRDREEYYRNQIKYIKKCGKLSKNGNNMI